MSIFFGTLGKSFINGFKKLSSQLSVSPFTLLPDVGFVNLAIFNFHQIKSIGKTYNYDNSSVRVSLASSSSVLFLFLLRRFCLAMILPEVSFLLGPRCFHTSVKSL